MEQAWHGFTYEKQEVSHIGHEANLLKLNCEKAKQILGWEPKLDFEESVKLTADWHRVFKLSDGLDDLSEIQINEYFAQHGNF